MTHFEMQLTDAHRKLLDLSESCAQAASALFALSRNVAWIPHQQQTNHDYVDTSVGHTCYQTNDATYGPEETEEDDESARVWDELAGSWSSSSLSSDDEWQRDTQGPLLRRLETPPMDGSQWMEGKKKSKHVDANFAQKSPQGSLRGREKLCVRSGRGREKTRNFIHTFPCQYCAKRFARSNELK